jgi:serine/threonine-protein kinase
MAEHPEAIGKYRITRPLGKGAMGMVYEGFDPIIERRVAIKTILGEYLEAAEMQEAVARFKREAQAGGRLQHPSIVGVYEYGQDGEMAFIVMEYVEGRELKRMLADGPRFELIEIFEIMKQLLGALDYSHKQGVVHRDIKPANVMIMPGPKVKVMDFGIARLASSSLTQVGTVVGTPTHMSPEQLMGIPADGRADIWSSGVILYELLTGSNPFLAETPAAVMHRVLQLEPDPPSTINASLPPGFDSVLARALAKKADQRFQTAKEFQAALLQALQGKQIGPAATRQGTSRSSSDTEPAQGQGTRGTSAGTSSLRRLTLSDEALAEIERSLSRHVGPLAKVLIKQSQGEATSFDEFFRLLAENIPTPEEGRRPQGGGEESRERHEGGSECAQAIGAIVGGRSDPEDPHGFHPRRARLRRAQPRKLRRPARARVHQGSRRQVGQPPGTLYAARRSYRLRRGAAPVPRLPAQVARFP